MQYPRGEEACSGTELLESIKKGKKKQKKTCLCALLCCAFVFRAFENLLEELQILIPQRTSLFISVYCNSQHWEY